VTDLHTGLTPSGRGSLLRACVEPDAELDEEWVVVDPATLPLYRAAALALSTRSCGSPLTGLSAPSSGITRLCLWCAPPPENMRPWLLSDTRGRT
jgi:hypothetical protein